MHSRTIRILVIDPYGRDFSRIQELLDLCGVFRYEVDHAATREEVAVACSTDDYDCYFADAETILRGDYGAAAKFGLGGVSPIVWLVDSGAHSTIDESDSPQNSDCLPRVRLTLGVLLLAISSAMRRATRRKKNRGSLVLPAFLSS